MTNEIREQAAHLIECGIETISDPTKWFVGDLAVDEEGRSVSPASQEAAKFCAIGSVLHCAEEEYAQDSLFFLSRREPISPSDYAIIALCKVVPASFDHMMGEFNDSNDHQEVLTKMREAVELLRSENEVKVNWV